MNYISSFFQSQEKEEEHNPTMTKEQQDFLDHLQSQEGIFKILPANSITEILTLSIADLEFNSVAKNKDGKTQQKICLFLSSRLTIRVQDVVDKDAQGEAVSLAIPCLCIENLNFDVDQDQDQERFLPITNDLVLLKYQDDDLAKQGYVFFYPSQGKTWLIESDLSNGEAIQKFEELMCLMLYVIHQKRLPKASESLENYCMLASAELIFQSKDLNFIVAGAAAAEAGETIQKSHNVKAEEKIVKQKEVLNHFEKMTIKTDDEMAYDQVVIKERIIQVSGHLFKYDSQRDENILVAKDTFLCLDRKDGDSKYNYMIQVTDQKQKISFTRTDIQTSKFNYSFSEQERLLMWMSKFNVSTQEIPAWSFILEHDQEVPRLKGALTKVIFETNINEDIERAMEREDESYLESQVLGDRAKDVDMEAVDAIEDYEYQNYDCIDMEEDVEGSQSEDSEKEAKNNRGQNEASDEDENTESIQAQGYERTFIVSGPVIKVYKKSDHEDTSENQRLIYDMDFPKIVNEYGDKIKPCNVMLHQNESQMIFCDEYDRSQLYNFDMEAGKIVEQFTADKNQELSQMQHIANRVKNGQSSAENTFVGINDRAIYTLDPRINKKEKQAQSKIYKTNPQFSQIATTLQGNLAIGSLSGEIRLYKEVGQNAKTLLPGLGDSIRSVNMSIDGEWIIATTQTYLLVIPTMCANGKTGFDHRMGKEKPTPKKLQIHVKDIAKHQIKYIDFTPAKFNNYNISSGEETSIVTSSGPYIFTWNFKKVQKGLLKCYKIKKLAEKSAVVDSQFEFNNDEKILITEPKNIGVQTRSKKVTVKY